MTAVHEHRPTPAEERCAACLNALRVAYRTLDDAGVAKPFLARFASIASLLATIAVEAKAALGGQEADGFDDPTRLPVVPVPAQPWPGCKPREATP